jgi:ADP-heptose:LPS heptosyltransferase
MKTPRRILLVKPSSMGDVLHALPVVSAIHAHWPQTEIRWLVQPVWRSLVEGHPGVAETILFPREKFRGLSGWLLSLGWLRTLRDWKPDLAIDLQGLLRSALFSRISGADQVIGLSDAREGARLLTGKKASVNRNDHAVHRNLAVLDLLGIPRPNLPEFLLPAGKLPEGFSSDTPFVVLHPYARGEGKSLTSEQVKAFIRGAAPVRVVVVGRGEALKNLPSNAEDWTNRTDLSGLIAILRASSSIVSTDSGPMHLAAALQPSRTLAIHLWSDPLKVGPCFPESMVWKNGRVATVDRLDDSWRPVGRIPTEEEMEELGRMAAAASMKSEG